MRIAFPVTISLRTPQQRLAITKDSFTPQNHVTESRLWLRATAAHCHIHATHKPHLLRRLQLRTRAAPSVAPACVTSQGVIDKDASPFINACIRSVWKPKTGREDLLRQGRYKSNLKLA